MRPFSNILFVASPGTDDSVALNQAVAIATANHAQLTVVGVIDDVGKNTRAPRYKPNALRHAMIEQRRDELASLISGKTPAGSTIDVKVLVGKVFLEVIREVQQYQHDLVIKSAESIERVSHLFGSTDLSLLRNCPSPVWIVKSTQQQGYRKIVAAVDYDPENHTVDDLNGQILELATSIALAEFAELHVVHAWRLPHESFLRSPRTAITNDEVDTMVEKEKMERRHWLNLLIATHCAEAADYLEPKIQLPEGSARHWVPTLVREIDAELVVMGTVGRTGIPGFVIGNTAETILNQIDCSVLTVKPPGFTSPVTEA